MLERKVILSNKDGLHARAAAMFVQVANKFSSNVYIEFDGKRVDGKSIMGVMALGAFAGEEIIIITNGVDEEKAMEELTNLVTENMKDII